MNQANKPRVPTRAGEALLLAAQRWRWAAVKRLRSTIVLVAMALVSTSTLAADWQTIRPQVTTERELISIFGAPDEVVSTYPWTEWSANWKKRPKASHYTLEYGNASESILRVGPAGRADSVEVMVADRRSSASPGTTADLRQNPPPSPCARIEE
jgi:hypothetical protein